MTALKVIGWIIVAIIALNLLFFILTLLLMSVKITLGIDAGESDKKFRFKWGFFGLKVYPEMFTPEKKEKFKAFAEKMKAKFGPLIDKIKAKKEKKKKDNEEEKKEKLTFDQVIEKLKNFDFKGAYQKAKSIFEKLGSFGGILELLKYIASKTNELALKMLRAFTFKELFIDFTVAGKDAADTAMNYGKTSAVAFPALGVICTNLKVREYDLDINPDFLADKNTGDLHTVITFRPIKIVVILTGYGLKIFNKFLVKILFSRTGSSKDKKENQKSKIEIGGA